MGTVRRRHSRDMKVKVASAAIGGTKSMNQLSSDHGVHVSQIKEWKTQALEAMRERFSSRRGRKKRDEVDESRLSFCLEALEAALSQATPDIFNTDQGSQFTSSAFTAMLQAAGIAISMDGRGSYHDNIFTERLWRSIKYEEVYLKEYASLAEAEEGNGTYINRYNHWRPHQALAYKTPAQVHFALADAQPVDMMDNIPLRSMLPT